MQESRGTGLCRLSKIWRKIILVEWSLKMYLTLLLVRSAKQQKTIKKRVELMLPIFNWQRGVIEQMESGYNSSGKSEET